MPTVTVGRENSADIQIHYEDHGAGQPVVPDGRATGTHARYLDQLIHKRSRQMTQLSTSKIPEGFTEKTALVNGVTLNSGTEPSMRAGRVPARVRRPDPGTASA